MSETEFRNRFTAALPMLEAQLRDWPGLSREDREDLLIGCMASAWQDLSRYDRSRSQFSTWLVTILRRDVSNHLVTAGRQKRGGGVPPVSIDAVAVPDRLLRAADDTEAEAIERVTWQRVHGRGWGCRLTPLQRECCILLCRGLEQEDIGTVVGSSSAAVAQTLRTCRRKFGARNSAHLAALFTAQEGPRPKRREVKRVWRRGSDAGSQAE